MKKTKSCITLTPDLADYVLPPIPLLLEHGRRGHSVCWQELLLRLVERQERRRVLEKVEPAGALLVPAPRLQASCRGRQNYTVKLFMDWGFCKSFIKTPCALNIDYFSPLSVRPLSFTPFSFSLSLYSISFICHSFPSLSLVFPPSLPSASLTKSLL